MKKTVYIAGPLFSKSELDFNLRLNEFLKSLEFNTFLPQQDGYLLSNLVDNGLEKDQMRFFTNRMLYHV